MEVSKLTEFETKYIIDHLEDSLIDQIVNAFLANNFSFIGMNQKNNIDEYFDTAQLLLYREHGSLRIRENNGKFKGTLKMPLDENSLYMSRKEIPFILTGFNVYEFIQLLKAKVPNLNWESILGLPILQSNTQRTNLIFRKDQDQIQLSLDSTTYTNHFLEEVQAFDKMIEIEKVEDTHDNGILLISHNIMMQNIGGLSVNKQSKYERGIDKTTEAVYKDKDVGKLIKVLGHYNKKDTNN